MSKAMLCKFSSTSCIYLAVAASHNCFMLRRDGARLMSDTSFQPRSLKPPGGSEGYFPMPGCGVVVLSAVCHPCGTPSAPTVLENIEMMGVFNRTDRKTERQTGTSAERSLGLYERMSACIGLQVIVSVTVNMQRCMHVRVCVCLVCMYECL